MLFLLSYTSDEFQEEVGSDYPNCVISTLSLPNLVSPHPTPISQHSESQAFCCSSCKGKGGSDDKGSCNRSLLGTGIHSSVNELQDGSEIPSSTPRWKIVTSDIMNADAPDTVQKLTAVEELEDIHTSTGSGSEVHKRVHNSVPCLDIIIIPSCRMSCLFVFSSCWLLLFV